jgi:AraC family transcriptional regulator
MPLILPSGQLFGRRLRSRDFAELKLMETDYASGAQIPKHAHERASLCLVLEGAYNEISGGRDRLCQPRSLTFYAPGKEHSDHFHESGGRCFNVEVSTVWLERVREYSKVAASQTEFSGGTPSLLASKLYKEFQLMDEVAPLAIEGLMLEIVAEASRQTAAVSIRATPARIEQAKQFLHAHFRSPIRLEQIAQAVGAHPVYVAREFRRHFGLTVGEYTRQLRVDLACFKLASSHDPLANIAVSSGFSDQSHLSRAIKNSTGMTPSQYRRVYRKR